MGWYGVKLFGGVFPALTGTYEMGVARKLGSTEGLGKDCPSNELVVGIWLLRFRKSINSRVVNVGETLSTIVEAPSPGLAAVVVPAVMDELSELPAGSEELGGREFIATRVSGKLSDGFDVSDVYGFELGGSSDGLA